MVVPARWLRQTRRTYFGNAAAQRDFRVQLRGNRSMILFGIYLTVLIGAGFLKYDTIARDTAISVVDAQRQLRDFYEMVVYLLGGMVSIVTPGLAATAIVLERQRRSLDLVFSAPVEPRYYLVGKMIAVYRYIWMLLILSLPVTAACVVLGGASWSDVLSVYVLLSFHGLLFAAIGLLVSTLSAKPVSAVVWTYAAVGGYLFASGSAAAASAVSRFSPSGMTRGETPFVIGLNPFTTLFTVGTRTVVFGHDVPNVILAALAILIGVRLCLLGAGSVLSEGRETANLRIQWLVVAACAAYGLTYWFASSGGITSLGAARLSGIDPKAVAMGMGLFWFLSPLAIVLPTLAAYGSDGAMRQRANGWFGVRHAFDGTPAGALPYIVLLVAVAFVSGLAGAVAARAGLPSLAVGAYVLYVLGYWAFFWAVARVASSYRMGLKGARTAVVATFIVVAVLPVPFFSALSAETFDQSTFSLWDLYLLRPVLQFSQVRISLPLVYGVVLIALSLALVAWSESNRKRLEARPA